MWFLAVGWSVCSVHMVPGCGELEEGLSAHGLQDMRGSGPRAGGSTNQTELEDKDGQRREQVILHEAGIYSLQAML